MEKMLGVMLDCSRNAVMKPERVKEFAAIIKKMGYNTLMLYTEDTYEIDSQPFFGYMRGKYLKSELADIDAYCKEIGVELVPCIQTLAHLNCMFKWQDIYEEIRDIDDILLAENEKTYELIDDMFRNLSGCISSRKIHIGMDEAYMVGLGKYRTRHGIKDRFEIINKHLHRVCNIAKKYGYEPMIWSDMFVKLALNTENNYDGGDISNITEKAALPENISLVYWDYYNENAEKYEEMMKINRAFGRKVYFAGGAWAWKGFAPNNEGSIKTTDAAYTGFENAPTDGEFITVWGDDGAECSPFAVLPALMYAAKRSKGKDDMDILKKEFKEITGADFDSIMLLDKVDEVKGHSEMTLGRNPSKYLLYNDPFMGLADNICKKEDNEYYAQLAVKIKEAEKNAGELAYLFASYEKLCEVLAHKADLGVRTRAAYKNRNMAEIKELAEEYGVTIDMIKEFVSAFRDRWYNDDNPHGFDVQELRIGGIIMRLKSCKERLEAFAEGKTECIPELEEEILDSLPNRNHWSRISTPNVVSHIF